jgi:hypothetical protein
MPASCPAKSLAQVLFECSPNVGWQGSWEHLGDAQRRWWEAFANVAREYLAKYEFNQADPADTPQDKPGGDPARD